MSGRENFLVLFFKPYESSDSFRAYSFGEDGRDSDTPNAFNPIVYDAISEFAAGQVVLYDAPYRQLTAPKKPLFGKIRPAKFKDDGATTRLKQRLKQRLKETGWNDGWFADRALSAKGSFFPDDYKGLFILQNRLDMELFKSVDMTYMDEGACGTGIVIFPETQVKKTGSPEEIIDHYRLSENYAISIYPEIILAQANIIININYISEQQLIERLQAIVQKHNKTLEVHL